jgi:hypothetical protein
MLRCEREFGNPVGATCVVRFGNTAAKPIGGSTSLLEVHAAWLLELIAKHPDLTLDEIVVAMRQHGIDGSRSAVWRFFERHKITVKKKSVRAAEQERADVGAGAPALDERACIRRRDCRFDQHGAAARALRMR